MSRPEIAGLARAMRSHARRTVERHGRRSYHADVLQVDPLVVDVHGLDLEPLDEDEVTIGEALATRLADAPLTTDDTLVLVEMDDDDFVAVEVLRG